MKYDASPTISAFIVDEKPYTFVVGPIGSGKSVGGVMKIFYRAAKQEPSPVDGIRYSRWLVVRNTNKELQDTTLKTFFDWFPPGIAGEWHATSKTFVYKRDGLHCEIMFRALDRPDDASSVLSLELTGAMIDEFVEIPREILDAVHSRCDRYPSASKGGCTWAGVWGASNPGTQDSWWYDFMYEEWPDEVGGAAAQDESMSLYEQPSGFSPQADNLKNLKPYKAGCNDYYINKAKGKTLEWVKQFIEVQWGYSQKGKAVYKMFNRELHVAKQPLKYNPHLPLILGFDAGLTPAMVFMQQDSFGRVLILDELVSENMGAQRFCREKVKPLLNRKYQGASVVVAADPATKQRAQTDERTVASVLEKELGVKVKGASSNDLAARLGAVDSFLTLLTEAGPALLIDPNCKTTISGFSAGYKYAINTKGVTGDKPDKNFYSHCFTGETLVRTSRGDVPIRDVVVGDMAFTPAGYKPVLATMSADVEHTLRLTFSDGAKLQCTADHPFVTNRGRVLAHELRHDDILFSINKENTRCQQPNTPSSNLKGLGFIRNLAGILSRPPATKFSVNATCTEPCGCSIEALYQPHVASTTKTTTKKITPSKTYGCSQGPSICHTTARSGTSVTLSPYYGVYRLHSKLRLLGISRKRVGRGIGSTVSTPIKRGSESCVHAHGAASSTKASRGWVSAVSALCRVRVRLASLLGSTMWTRPVRGVEACSAATSTTKPQHAARLVQQKTVTENVRVYDLTVADEHVFYANGILVGNCHDAIQYGAMAFVDGAAREARARKHAHFNVQSRNTYVLGH